MSLRPQGQHHGLRRAAAAHGARLLALSPWRLRPCDDDAAKTALAAALAADRIVFTSPAAVRAAGRLSPLRAADPDQCWLAVGAGSARALRRAGIVEVHAPHRMDSEGLLALPQLQSITGLDVGLVTAPGGRGEIANRIRARGARLHRADVYRREPVRLSGRACQALLRTDDELWLALSSGEALQRLWPQLSDPARTRLLQARVVVASARLAALARTFGFHAPVIAASARPADLIAAACRNR